MFIRKSRTTKGQSRPKVAEGDEGGNDGDWIEYGLNDDFGYERSCFAGKRTEKIFDRQSKTCGEAQYSGDCSVPGCGTNR